MTVPDDLRRRSVRFGAQVAALLVALVGLVGGAALWLYESSEHRAAQEELEDRARVLTPATAPSGTWIVWQAGGERRVTDGLPRGLPVEGDLRAVADDGRARQREVERGGRTYFVRTQRRGAAVVQVAVDRTDIEAAGTRVLTALSVASAAGVALAAVIAAVLAQRALGPLAEALALQRRFVSDAGHELRTPVTLLSTRAQLLARRMGAQPAVPAFVREELDGLRADASALGEVLEDLLLAADPGGSDRSEVADVAALVTACRDAAAATARTQGVEIVVTAPGPVPARVVPAALRRAVAALLANALDHASTRVEAAVTADRRRLRVVVRDDGPGLPSGREREVFERFATVRPPAEGSGRRHYGLGLALVAEVAAAHGGSVGVLPPDPARPGAAFVLDLPRGMPRGRGREVGMPGDAGQSGHGAA